MDQRDGRRRLVVAALSGLVVVAWTASLAVASGATAASARLIDGSGAEIGWAKLTQDAAGRLHVNVQVAGMTPGRHGIHLHAVGSCLTPAFTSAGGHHNPLGAQHGLENPAGAHAGDLPNLEVNLAGRGHLQAMTDLATLSAGPLGLFDANGSAVIIHAAEDDQSTDPTGNSGARVACGVIEVDG
jgi:superoxide dismutase, Cu-Zn family